MSTDDQTRASALTGEALKAARDEVPQEILDRIAAAAGDDRLRTVTAGELAGFWMANHAVGRGEDLIAAGLMLIPDRSTARRCRTGYDRGRGSLEGYDPSG